MSVNSTWTYNNVEFRWNFLTIQKEYLGLFAFLLFDTDHTGYLDSEEMVELIYTIHNTKNTRQKTIGQVVEKLRSTKEIYNDVKFEQWIRSHMSLMEPIQILQRNLRMHIIGEKFWNDLTDTRSTHPEFGEIKHIARLKQRAIEIRQNQIRDLHLKRLKILKGANPGESGASKGPGRGMGRRTTSMLRFFGLTDDQGNFNRRNKRKGPVGNRKKVQDCGGNSTSQPCQIMHSDDESDPATQSPKPTSSGKHRPHTPPPVQINDVIHLPMKARRRRSSLFGRPDLRRSGDTKTKPTDGKRAIRKRRRQKVNGEGGFADIGDAAVTEGGMINSGNTPYSQVHEHSDDEMDK